jgi:hypothetical protein
MSKAIAALFLLPAACASVSTAYTVRAKDYSERDGALAEEVAATNPEDVLVCRMEAPTGTRVARRICRNDDQLAVVHQSSQEWLRSLRRGNTGGPYKNTAGGHMLMDR